ncbi:MAG: penicillin-binding protein 2 [Thermoleophilales bacterium]|nr:penicillin-binding protein 2 [Thermoleophilales bacterium]
MMYRDSDRKAPMSPQLALRVAIIGGVALVVFGIIFFRLWYLQVLSGDKYLAEANNNRVREIKVEAPRGKIVDTNGQILVDNRQGKAVKLQPDKLPKDPKQKAILYSNLARVLHMNRRTLRRDANQQFLLQPFSAATAKPDVDMATVAYLQEHQAEFPGVTVEQVFQRWYPQKQIGAHLVGYVAEVSQDALKKKLYTSSVKSGDRVGVAGIESSYDRYLRGRDGASRVQVDSMGNPHGELATRPVVPGRQLRLTLDLNVQRMGQQTMGAAKGGFVVMDVKTGAIRALGSSPSYDPNVFSKQIRQKDFTRLTDPANGAPMANRATQGLYPTGSVFKLISSVAGLQSGQITPGSVVYDGGSLKVGDVTFKNAGGVSHGPVALVKALQVSSDVFFYTLGRDDNGQHSIQKWARRLGFGHPTGIDLPGESDGLVPNPKWRNDIWAKHGKKLPYRPWSVGDNVNLSVGQGDLQANPLQVAVAYAAVANGGYVVKPHLADRTEDADGAAIQEFNMPARHKLDIAPQYRASILDGLHQAARSPGGTSYPVFSNFPVEVAGKTGTAQKGIGRAAPAWYAGLAPYPHPRYVVVSTFESGGFGADTAAPAACKILTVLLNVRKKDACAGKTATAPNKE